MKGQSSLAVLGFVYLAWIDLCKGLTILLEDGNEAPGSVNVIENTRFELYCDGGSALPQRIVWRKLEDGDFEILNANLTFLNIQEVHAGTYECQDEVNSLMETVTVRILYPPSLPTISGPNEVLIYSTITLNCTADSVPEPSFYWTFYEDSNSQVLARGNQYVDTADGNYHVYCWAENTMFPTIGQSVTSARPQNVMIKALESAYIWELYDSYEFNVSTDLIVNCRVAGEPYPTVWWTRDDDPEFRFDDERLYIQNVDLDFSGNYRCHAENILAPMGQNTTVSKTTLITITDPGIPEVCRGPCQSLVDEATSTCTCNEVTKDVVCDSGCKNGLIAAAVIGWILALVLMIVILFCWIRHWDRKRKGTAKQNDTRVESKKPETDSDRPRFIPDERLANRPVLPVRPDTTRRNEDTYSYIRGEESSGVPLSTGSGKYDYLEPTPSLMKHDYLQLDQTNPVRTVPEGAANNNADGRNRDYNKYDDVTRNEGVKISAMSNPIGPSTSFSADGSETSSPIVKENTF